MKGLLKTWLLLVLVIILAVTITGCGGKETAPGAKETEPEFVWTLSSNYTNPQTTQEFNSFGRAQQLFADLVGKRSEGRLVIDTYYDSVMGNPVEIFEEVRRGETEMFYGQPRSTVDKRFGVLNLPFLIADYDEAIRLVSHTSSPLFKLTEEWLADYDIKLLAIGASVFRDFVNTKHPIKTPDDMRQLKVRVYEDSIVQAFWGGMANPIPMPFGEVYTSLEMGAIDALEFSPTGVLGYNIYEVTDYYTDLQWQWTSGANLTVNQRTWDELPADLQAIVKQAAEEAMAYQTMQSMMDTQKAYAELEKRGMKIHRLTPEERQGFIDAAKEIEPKLREIIGAETFDMVIRIVEEARR